MKKTKDIPYGPKLFWKYVSLSRNACAVIIGTFLAYLLSRNGTQPFRITGNITAGLPPFQFPAFSTTIDGVDVTFKEMIGVIGPSLAAIPMVAILEVVAIAKAFSKGKIVNASQEMIALGMCNIMGSFVLSMPVTGSFTRTAVNNASGVRTPLGCIVTGSLVLMALAFLTQTFYFIPKTTLAAIIITAMVSLVELDKITDMFRSKKRDLFPFVVTWITCLLWSLEYGILCGVVANSLYLLYRSARPQINLTVEKVGEYEVGVVDVKQRLDFAAAEYLVEKVVKFVNNQTPPVRLMVLKGEKMNSIDYTVAQNIIVLNEDLKVLKCDLICLNWNIASAGVVVRLKQDLREMFIYEQDFTEAVYKYLQHKYLETESNNTSLESIKTP